MSLTLHNTLARGPEPFEPLTPGRVGVYACGPTVYDVAHIGNFRTFLFYDLVHRYLEWSGFSVHFVMNLTDVDDKTIEAARERGVELDEYTAPYREAFLEDSAALGIREVDLYPRATAYVDRMIELVARLLERGLAYTTDDGSVYFDISAFPEYGRLSGRDPASARPGERVAADEYEKDDVRDFALWKGVKPEDEEVGAAWDAPWGRGRPGWHLECSVMALTEVGETVDLHLGGEDLIFPHHEDEIAQSEGATGRPFVRYWLHAKHLLVEGRKMSKSLGNFVTVRDLLEGGADPAALRHLLLSAHYRSELNFTREGLEASARAVARLVDFEARLRDHPVDREAAPGGLAAAADRAETMFREAMDADLNVAGAWAALFTFVREANQILGEHPALPGSETARALEVVSSLDGVLGVLELARGRAAADPEFEAWVEERIRARRQAREARDWDRADAIRDELSERGVILEDGPRGTRWKRAAKAG